MGARHPQDLINKLGANKSEFIMACTYLVRMGIVKGPGDAIRYMEEKEITVEQVIEKFIDFHLKLQEKK